MPTVQQIMAVIGAGYFLSVASYVTVWLVCIWHWHRQNPPRQTWPLRQKFPLV